MNGGHDEGALGSYVVVCQPEGLLHDLGYHGGWGPVAQHLLDNLACVRHPVQYIPCDGGIQIRAHNCLLLPHLQERVAFCKGFCWDHREEAGLCRLPNCVAMMLLQAKVTKLFYWEQTGRHGVFSSARPEGEGQSKQSYLLQDVREI